MQRSTLSVLACPCCREAYEAIDQVGSDEQIEQGFLRCSCRTTVIPIVAGFAMFAESLLHESQAHPEALARAVGLRPLRQATLLHAPLGNW